MSSSRTGSSIRHNKKKLKTREKSNRNPSLDDHEALCRATDAALRKIITTDEHFADLPPDCTLEEIEAEIALARALATKIYVKRDGLPTLKVVLPQQNPTIANLKRAIERTANLLQHRKAQSNHHSPPQVSTTSSHHRRKATVTSVSTDTPPPIRPSGGLIAAPSTRAARSHRVNASWRFLWRAYALTKAQDSEQASSTLKPLPDANGRQLLSDFGIGHKSVLRFVKRENYFGRQRQRS